MRDQAAGLRKLAADGGRRLAPGPSPASVIVVGSGKGGVGKSVLSVMLASRIAREGRRVLLFDGSQNQGNLHILLGVRPAARIDALLSGEIEPEDLLMQVAERLWLLPVDSGTETVYALTATDRARLHLRLTALYDSFDTVVIDVGPGIDSAVRATMLASRLVVVAVPEPASLSDAYALIKIVTLQASALPIDVLINRAACEEEAAAAFERLNIAAGRFLRRELGYLGSIAENPALRQAVRHPGSLLVESPADVAAIAERLMAPAPAPAAALVACGSPDGQA